MTRTWNEENKLKLLVAYIHTINESKQKDKSITAMEEYEIVAVKFGNGLTAEGARQTIQKIMRNAGSLLNLSDTGSAPESKKRIKRQADDGDSTKASKGKKVKKAKIQEDE